MRVRGSVINRGGDVPVNRIRSPNFKDTDFVSPVLRSLINKEDPTQSNSWEVRRVRVKVKGQGQG